MVYNSLTEESDDGENKSVHTCFIIRSSEVERKKFKLSVQKCDDCEQDVGRIYIVVRRGQSFHFVTVAMQSSG